MYILLSVISKNKQASVQVQVNLYDANQEFDGSVVLISYIQKRGEKKENSLLRINLSALFNTYFMPRNFPSGLQNIMFGAKCDDAPY